MQIIRDKKNLKVKDSSTSMPIHAMPLVGEADTITEPDISHKHKIFNHLLPPSGLVLSP